MIALSCHTLVVPGRRVILALAAVAAAARLGRPSLGSRACIGCLTVLEGDQDVSGALEQNCCDLAGTDSLKTSNSRSNVFSLEADRCERDVEITCCCQAFGVRRSTHTGWPLVRVTNDR